MKEQSPRGVKSALSNNKVMTIKPCNQHAFPCTKDTLAVVVYKSDEKYKLEFHSGIPEILLPKFHNMSEFFQISQNLECFATFLYKTQS